MKTLRDPQGRELKLVLFQVVDRDANGPRTLRVRHDHEKIDIANATEAERTFLLVWVPVNEVLGEMQMSDIFRDYEEVKEKAAALHAQVVQTNRDIDNVRREHASLSEELKTKTEALRALQKERDPERVNTLIASAVKVQTAALEDQVRDAAAPWRCSARSTSCAPRRRSSRTRTTG